MDGSNKSRSQRKSTVRHKTIGSKGNTIHNKKIQRKASFYLEKKKVKERQWKEYY